MSKGLRTPLIGVLVIVALMAIVYFVAGEKLQVQLLAALVWSAFVGVVVLVSIIWKYLRTIIRRKILWRMVGKYNIREEIKINGRDAAQSKIDRYIAKRNNVVLVVFVIVAVASFMILGVSV